MLPGKLVAVKTVSSIEDLIVLLERLTGYCRCAWRMDGKLVSGYIIVENDKIVGALVEDILSKQIIPGDTALNIIIDALKDKRVHMIDVYEAEIEDIFNMFPSAKLSAELNLRIELISAFLNKYTGGIEIKSNGVSWSIYTENGTVKFAKASDGNAGNVAFKELIQRMGEVLEKGEYHFDETSHDNFEKTDEVGNGALLRDVVDLLKEKLKLDKIYSQKQ